MSYNNVGNFGRALSRSDGKWHYLVVGRDQVTCFSVGDEDVSVAEDLAGIQ